MRNLIPTFIFCITCFSALSQNYDSIDGIYKSKKKSSDIYTLNLKSDSLYSLTSEKGENWPDGKWSIEEKELILHYEFEGTNREKKLRVKYSKMGAIFIFRSGGLRQIKLRK